MSDSIIILSLCGTITTWFVGVVFFARREARLLERPLEGAEWTCTLLWLPLLLLAIIILPFDILIEKGIPVLQQWLTPKELRPQLKQRKGDSYDTK